MFMSKNLLQPVTSFLLDVLCDDAPEHAELQTRLIEMNIEGAPQVAYAILGNNMFTHYDRVRIAELCEKAGWLSEAMAEYKALKRIALSEVSGWLGDQREAE